MAQVVSALGYALSMTTHSLTYARKAYTFILSRQLLRPDGIRGLCESVFVQEDVSEENAPLVGRSAGCARCAVRVASVLFVIASETVPAWLEQNKLTPWPPHCP